MMKSNILFCFAILLTVVSCATIKNGKELMKIKNDTKTVYTLEQIELIVCEHREALYIFKCNFEYAKIDVRTDLEENRRKSVCDKKSLDPIKQCNALRHLGCNPHHGLKEWCVNRKTEIENQREMWHKVIAITCHKNLVKHTETCKNGKKKYVEGDKHISPAQITEFLEKEKENENGKGNGKGNTKKPKKLVEKSKPTTVKPVTHPKSEETVINQSANEILINYIFGESKFDIEIEDLILFISHVFKENEKSFIHIKPSVVTIQHDKVISKPTIKPIEKPTIRPIDKPIIKPIDKPIIKPIEKPTIKPSKPTKRPSIQVISLETVSPEYLPFIEHVISEGKPDIEKPILPVPFNSIDIPSKTKVNKRLTELLLDYIYGLNRPLETEKELQFFIDHLFEEEQRFIKELKLRKTLIEIIIGYRPSIPIIKPINVPIVPHPTKKPSKPEKKPILVKPVLIPYLPKDVFDVSFIFKIADELLTPRDHSFYNQNYNSNLEHYKFLLDENEDQQKQEVENEVPKIKQRKVHFEQQIEENKKSLSDRAHSSINDLMNSMNIE